MPSVIRPTTTEDRAWVRARLDDAWGGPIQVVDGRSFEPATLPGFVAEDASQIVGFAVLEVYEGHAWLALIDVLRPREGIGTALVDAVADEARARGYPHLRVVTTNDNVTAQRFYRACGFRLVATRPGAVHRSRAVKPSIPLLGEDGTPMTDELEFERTL